MVSTKRTRDKNKRMKGMGIPIDLCVKFERKIGLKPGEKPDYCQRIKISDLMISAMQEAVKDVVLSDDDKEQIKEEIKHNEDASKGNS